MFNPVWIRSDKDIFLYMIWSEKSHFLKRGLGLGLAIELNPFQNEHLLWVDIGCFRVPNTQYIDWPNHSKMVAVDKSKVLMLLVEPFTREELESISLPLFQYKNRKFFLTVLNVLAITF